MGGLNNFTFAAAIIDLVRDASVQFDTRLLSYYRRAVKATRVPVDDVPIEGAYDSSPQAAEALRLKRALQNHYSDVVTADVELLHRISSDPVYGLGPEKETALNRGEGVVRPAHLRQKAVLSPMVDTLDLALQNLTMRTGSAGWNIQDIMNETESLDLGTHLVGLGILVDRHYKDADPSREYNPVATALAAEATVSSRSHGMVLGGEPSTPVSSEILQLSLSVLRAYNRLFASVPEAKDLVLPTDLSDLEKNANDVIPFSFIGRCVRIGVVSEGISPTRYYHFGVSSKIGSRYPDSLYATDFTADHVVTTAEYSSVAFEEYKQVLAGENGLVLR